MYAVKYGTGFLNSRVEVNESGTSQTIYTSEVQISYTVRVRVCKKGSASPISGVSVTIFQQNQRLYCQATTNQDGVAECTQTSALGRGVLKISDDALEPHVERFVQTSVLHELNVSLGARDPAKSCAPITAYARHNRAVVGTNCSELGSRLVEQAAGQFSLRDTKQGIYAKGSSFSVLGSVLVITFYPRAGLIDSDQVVFEDSGYSIQNGQGQRLRSFAVENGFIDDTVEGYSSSGDDVTRIVLVNYLLSGNATSIESMSAYHGLYLDDGYRLDYP